MSISIQLTTPGRRSVVISCDQCDAAQTFDNIDGTKPASWPGNAAARIPNLAQALRRVAFGAGWTSDGGNVDTCPAAHALVVDDAVAPLDEASQMLADADAEAAERQAIEAAELDRMIAEEEALAAAAAEAESDTTAGEIISRDDLAAVAGFDVSDALDDDDEADRNEDDDE